MPERPTVRLRAALPARSSSAVQARLRPQPFAAMQADMPSSIWPQRRTGEVNQSSPVLALRLFTAPGTALVQAS